MILNATVAVYFDEKWGLAADDYAWLIENYIEPAGDDQLVLDNFDERIQREQERPQHFTTYGGTTQVWTHGSYPSSSSVNESFYRFSAFWPDMRIARNGSVRAGTYVTTQTDMPFVSSGLGAVGRYALPNPAPAIFRYQIGPLPAPVPIVCGSCVPRFGKAGGGVEVQFTKSLVPGSANPVLTSIPER